MAKFHDQMECINSALEGNQFGIDLSSLIIQGDMPLYMPVWFCTHQHSSVQESGWIQDQAESAWVTQWLFYKTQ